MDAASKLVSATVGQQAVCRATAMVDAKTDALAVRFADGRESPALVLQTGLPLTPNAGDTVLVCLPEREEELPVVLGRVAAYGETGKPDELVIEAGRSLELKCGEGKLTIRRDKVLVKGKEVVSRAKGANQIKGGSVSIN